MNPTISQWKKIKQSGHFKRTLKKIYERIQGSDTRTSVIVNEVAATCSHIINPSEHEFLPNGDADLYGNKEIRNFDEAEPMHENKDSSDEEDEKVKDLSHIQQNINVNKQLRVWATSFNITHSALRELFRIWNERIPNILPKDSRTFLNTPKVITLIKMDNNGLYWHNGLKKNLVRLLENIPDHSIRSISLNINIDGLPIYKSSKCEFWPILCNIYELPQVKPVVIGIYSGTGKPANINTFLQEFVSETKQVLADGLFINSSQGIQRIDVTIRCFICDSPARAFIKGVANFNAKHGCLKCTTTGEYSYISHTVYFPRHGCPQRTNDGFRSRLYGKHHKTDSPLEALPIDMIEDFPVGDSLHLIDLGIMKRCLVGWKDGTFGNYSTKWSFRDIQSVSQFLVNCKLPSELHRTVRGLDVLKHWKGTEYRTFLLYIGIVVLRKCLSTDAYQHFLLLFCAITICSSPIFRHFLPLAETLLEHFVETYRDIYGEDYMSSNVHNLSHLVSEVKQFGVLTTFNAYPFENRLFQIKTLLRNGNSPLSQVAKRIEEILNVDICQVPTLEIFPKLKNSAKNGISQSIQFENFSLNSKYFKDKWFLAQNNDVVSLKNAVMKDNIINIYGYRINTQKFFNTPISSYHLNIYKSNCIQGPLKTYLISDVKCKLVAICDESDVIFIPLLHSYITNSK